MSIFTSELSGSLIFNSASSAAAIQPYSGGINISGSELYINEVGLDTRISSIEAGNAGSQSLYPLNVHSASINAFTGSLNNYTASRLIDSASFDSRIDSIFSSVNTLTAATSSYLTDVPAGTISSSAQLDTLGYVTSSVAEIPAGTLSSSAQVLELGFITGSPEGTISSSGQLDTLGYLTSESAAAAGFGSGGGSIPAGTVSSSQQIEDLGYLTSASAAAAGFGSGGASIPAGTISSSAQIAGLGYVTGSPDGTISSSAQIADLGYVTSSAAASIPDGTISSSQQIEDLGFDTGSSAFDGARIISNEDLGDLFSNNFNPGTSGSIQDFLDAVFFPNSAPSFSSTGSFFAAEFAASGSTLGTLTATDPEGQSLTFRANSAYTDGLVVIASNGVVTLAQSPTTEDFNNTDRGDGVLAHAVQVDAVDSFGTFTTSTIYIVINTNNPPVFRQTSIVGSIITSFTANRNENEGATEVGKIYFTDPEGDTITITSNSVSSDFTVTKYSNYVQIDQATGSLDFETTPTYQFSITASDAKFESGDDLTASASLVVTINVTDNVIPVVNDQTLSSINENSSDGTVVGNIAASDAESDTITFRNFTLSKLELDNVDVSTSTYGGTAQLTDPHEDPFQMTSAGQVTRKTGVFLNSDLINEYQYTVEVVDSFNTASDAGTITIGITDDTPASLTDNWSAGPYIIESALAGNNITVNSNGRTGTQADYGSNQSGTFTSSNAAISIDSNGSLTITDNLSGSLTGSGDTISSTITFTNTFGTTTTDSLNVSVAANAAPTSTITAQTEQFNTNLGTAGSTLLSGTITDDEGDTPYSASLSGTDAGLFEIVYTSADSSSFEVRAINDLGAGDYDITASVFDSFAKATQVANSETDITITQSDIGTLGGDTTSYIIESAESGDVLRDATGFNGGNASLLTVSYSPNHGTQAPQSFTSSNASIGVDNSGYLTIATNISGSSTGSGDTITSTISFTDQYGNVGSGSLTVNVFANQAPVGSFTQNSSIYNANEMVSSSLVETIAITDTESDAPFTVALTGTDASKLVVNPQNASTSSVTLTTNQDLAAGTYLYTASITDNFNKTTEYNRSVTIAAADTGTLTTNGTFYIIESATSGDLIRLSSNGRTGTQGDLGVTYSPNYGSQAVATFSSDNALIAVNNSGNLTVGTDISGSGNTSGDTITSTITFTDNYGNIGTDTITVNVATNNAPDIIFTNTSANLNTNLGTSGSTLTTISFSDTESDTILYDEFVGAESAGLNFKRSGNTYLVQPTGSLAADSYTISGSIVDNHGFSTNTESHTFTIAQADTGTLSTNGTFYIIESAVTNNPIVTNSNGRTGTTGSVSVSYSPNYGTQAATSFSASSAVIDCHETTGELTLASNISGSSISSGDTITSTIFWNDQYGNSDNSSININVTTNQDPTVASFTDVTANWTASNAQGTDLVTFTISDTESNTPFSASLSGTGASQLQLNYSNADSSSVIIEAASSLAAGTINYNVRVTDAFGKDTDYTGRTITVAAQPFSVYGYGISWAANPSSEAQFMGTAGDSGADGVGIASGSIIAKLQSGSIGGSFNTPYGAPATVTLYHSSSTMTTLDDNNGGNGVSSLGYFNFSSTSQHVLVVFPSASSLAGKPASMYDGVPPDSTGTDDEFYLYAKDASIPGTLGSGVYYFDTETAVEGYTRWGMIFSEGKNTNNSRAFLMPDSSSAP